MKAPTKKQLVRMQWARKAVNPDGTTRNGQRWPIGAGGWVELPADELSRAERDTDSECGHGLHLGHTARGLSSVYNLGEATILVVGYLPDDVLSDHDDKVRVKRCWVLPGVSGGVAHLARTTAYLARANLAGANLAGADLAGANLAGANLAGAYLAGAYLARANLAGAYLARANLAGAYLARANLAGAYLDRADLAGADLAGAYLAGAYLDRADRPSWLPARWIVVDGLIRREAS